MSVKNHQDFWLAGSRIYVRRKPVGATLYPLIDLGVVQPINPSIEVTEATLLDSDGGVRRVVDRQQTQVDESYDIVTNNLSMSNLALLFSGELESFTQAGTAVTDQLQPHPVKEGYLHKITTAAGVAMYGLASIQAVKDQAGSTTYVLNTDYEIVSLERGIIRIKEGGDIEDDDQIQISYTPNVLSGLRLLKPQSAGATIEADSFIYWSQNNNARQHVRECEVRIFASAAQFQLDDYSNFTLRLTVISDPTAATPAGRLLHFKGDVPTKS